MDIPSVIIVFLVFTATMIETSPVSHRKGDEGLHRQKRESDGDGDDNDGSCFGNIPLCNGTSQYPERTIRRLLGRYKRRFSPAFGTVVEPAEQADRSLFRSGLEVEEENLCRTRTVTMMPRTAYDAHMKKRYIVNVENHLQAVTFETCAETKCYGSSNLDTLSLNTFCQQRYTNVRLLYLKEENNAIEYGQFSIPSTCVCSYSKLIRL